MSSEIISNAKPVISNQNGPHEQIPHLVARHLAAPFRKPYPDFSLHAFEEANNWLQQFNRPIIFDSYCGVGESTVALAKLHPEASVIGLDKSLHRLNKHDEHYRASGVDNYYLLRADVDDFWRLAVDAQWQLSHHYLLYPNPWPKSAHIKRRCHGSPLFSSLLALGGRIELRSNWPLYVEEFAWALSLAGHPASAQAFVPDPVITPFERKYLAAQQTLYHCIYSLKR
ncbi:SAM-dependent methyltransferase [Dasania sp. GY-MA-18]|uniref:tRNA (guanine(46)-N(7))-methyltransferase n=1 Tax=Dasania phycosphaerae TaxID=2950436 RepID=A0A9J6RKA0_9GAMM|nr:MULTISPECIES: SAM-dependent methyltransferase [Dasania]MCR8922406.1 SAM-dependent methyltransferase [Dasania sp. GY-MA-18]MCZ0864834.1 SAM-dependent methyltransferase [Dasania phycosphaerae]MCZ0868562.1 SAM-dependent methyltransferase [Dasania phycosphaerae]